MTATTNELTKFVVVLNTGDSYTVMAHNKPEAWSWAIKQWRRENGLGPNHTNLPKSITEVH